MCAGMNMSSYDHGRLRTSLLGSNLQQPRLALLTSGRHENQPMLLSFSFAQAHAPVPADMLHAAEAGCSLQTSRSRCSRSFRTSPLQWMS